MRYRKTTEEELALVLEEGEGYTLEFSQIESMATGCDPPIARLKEERRIQRIGPDKGGFFMA